MLTANTDIHDCLINRQKGNNSHIEFAQSIFSKEYVKFSDKQAGLKAMSSSCLGRQKSWLPIEKRETEIPIKRALHFYQLSIINFL